MVSSNEGHAMYAPTKPSETERARRWDAIAR